MSKTEIIERTVIALRQLPEQKGEEVADFADFILSKIQEEQFQAGLQQVMEESETFAFLKDEDDLYTTDDIK